MMLRHPSMETIFDRVIDRLKLEQELALRAGKSRRRHPLIAVAVVRAAPSFRTARSRLSGCTAMTPSTSTSLAS